MNNPIRSWSAKTGTALCGVLLLCSVCAGCVSTSIISSSAGTQGLSPTFSVDGNGEAATMDFGWATIVFLDGRRLEAQNVTAAPDSASFLDIPGGSRTTVPTHTIDKIINNNKFIGLLEASGIGLLAGAGTGTLVAAIAGGGNAYAVVGLIAIGAAAGVLVGGFTGLILGHTYEYKFAYEERRRGN